VNRRPDRRDAAEEWTSGAYGYGNGNGSGKGPAYPYETVYQDALAVSVHDLAGRGTRTLMITSSEPEEGKSTIAADLATALARSSSESVCIVDVDQHRPALHRKLALPQSRGLSDLLEEVYLCSVSEENPLQFGIGDWVEIMRAQRRTGELRIAEGDHECSIRFVKGSVCSISCPAGSDETCLGNLMIERGRITAAQVADALHIQEETGRPIGDILVTLGWITGQELNEALNEQVQRRLRDLVTFRQPECRMLELVESYVPATAGRSQSVPETAGVDQLVSGRLHEYLRDPFLASQVPSYFTDTHLPNLKALTAGRMPCDLRSPRYLTPFQLLLTRLARAFDIVLLDAPPVSLVTATTALAPLADGVVLVVKADGPEVKSVRRAVEELRRAGGNVLGGVLNQVELKSDAQLSPYYQAISETRRWTPAPRVTAAPTLRRAVTQA
jgi:Mrp family chromosome partitioning ATPase